MAIRDLNSFEINCIIKKFGSEFYQTNLISQPVEGRVQFAAFHKCREKTYEVTVPGWEDIIKLGSEVELTDGELSLIREVRKVYPPDQAADIIIEQLGVDKWASYQKKRERAIRISKSPTPEIVRQIGEIMTYIDNIQDSLVTTTYLARVLGFVLRRIAPELLVKITPVVGWISLAKDILDLLNLLGLIANPRSLGKRGLSAVFSASPLMRGKKILAAKRLVELLPTFREAIQIAQTTDWAFGYGLSLGPILGFVEDAVFGLVRAAIPGGGEVEIRGLPAGDNEGLGMYWSLYAAPELIQSPGRRIYAKPLSPFDQHALRIMRSAPYVLQLGPELTTQERANTLYAVAQACDILRQSGATQGMVERMGPAVDMPLPAPRISSTVQALLDIEGIPHNGESPRYPLPLEAKELSPRMQAALLAPRVRSGIESGFGADKRSVYSVLGGEIITRYTDDLLRQVDGADVEIADVALPPAKALFTLLHYNLLPRLNRDPAVLERVYGLLSAEYIKSGEDQFSHDKTVALINLADGFKNPPPGP